ncbi:hypothetical protein CR513_33482, partial [Mucuna pruriens]
MANPNRKDWSRLLENALWAHKTAYQTPLRMSPYRIVFDKACHLPIEIEHRAYWTVKQSNMAYDQAGMERKLQLQELEEIHLEAYENSQINKQKTNPEIGVPSKLHSRWDGPFVITNVFPYGVVELKDKATNNTFQVNEHQLKIFHERPTSMVGEILFDWFKIIVYTDHFAIKYLRRKHDS